MLVLNITTLWVTGITPIISGKLSTVLDQKSPSLFLKKTSENEWWAESKKKCAEDWPKRSNKLYEGFVKERQRRWSNLYQLQRWRSLLWFELPIHRERALHVRCRDRQVLCQVRKITAGQTDMRGIMGQDKQHNDVCIDVTKLGFSNDAFGPCPISSFSFKAETLTSFGLDKDFYYQWQSNVL